MACGRDEIKHDHVHKKSRSKEEREGTSALNPPCSRHHCINHKSLGGGRCIPMFQCKLPNNIGDAEHQRGGEISNPIEVSGKHLWVHFVRCLCMLAPSSSQLPLTRLSRLDQATSATQKEFLGCSNCLALD